jgi:hypothetical protein
MSHLTLSCLAESVFAFSTFGGGEDPNNIFDQVIYESLHGDRSFNQKREVIKFVKYNFFQAIFYLKRR